jgi:hypothetical protein
VVVVLLHLLLTRPLPCGQGKSWPSREPEPEHGLVYSVDLWRDQLDTFIRSGAGAGAGSGAAARPPLDNHFETLVHDPTSVNRAPLRGRKVSQVSWVCIANDGAPPPLVRAGR